MKNVFKKAQSILCDGKPNVLHIPSLKRCYVEQRLQTAHSQVGSMGSEYYHSSPPGKYLLYLCTMAGNLKYMCTSVCVCVCACTGMGTIMRARPQHYETPHLTGSVFHVSAGLVS